MPFKDVYIHALVRDEHGQKMSKSKGNVLDPLDLTAKYGADALRFTLVAMAAQGRDLKLSENRIESYRNFATKLWNASRFLEMNDCVTHLLPDTVNEPVNQCILSEFNSATQQTALAIESYKFNEAADTLYHFVWNQYCDWYVEFIKPVLADSEETRLVAAYVLHQTLHLLSPFMPFITEELNAKLFGRDKMLMVADWPTAAAGASADTGISTVIDIISEIRTMRSEMNVPLSAKPVLVIRGVSDEQRGIIDAMTLPLLRLARLGGVSYHEGDFEKGTARTSLQGMDMGLPLTGILDFDAERARLKKEIAACEAEAGKIRGKLNNPNFVERAPGAVVAENNRRLEEEQSRLDGLKAALVRLDTE